MHCIIDWYAIELYVSSCRLMTIIVQLQLSIVQFPPENDALIRNTGEGGTTNTEKQILSTWKPSKSSTMVQL